MNIKQLNEELSKYLNEKLISNRRFSKKKSEVDRLEEQKLQERDRTFDDFDCDSYEEIVHGEYGGSMYIVTMNDTYFVYSKGDYGLTKEGKFNSYQDALEYIADDVIDREDPYEIEEMVDMGDFAVYDAYVAKRIKSWIKDSQDDEDYDESFKTKKSHKRKLKEQKLNESYYDFSWATSAEEIDFYNDTDSYNLININNKCFAIFTDEYTGGERITNRVSDWFDTKEEAMNYYYNNLTDEEDYDESFKTPSTKRLKKKLKECSDRGTIVELARKYGDNITLKDILAKIRNVDERLSDQARKSTSKFMKRIEKVDRNKKEK